MEIEIWKPVKGYEDLYAISNLGKIKSLSKPATGGKGNKPKLERILKPYPSYGYLMVDLTEADILEKQYQYIN